VKVGFDGRQYRLRVQLMGDSSGLFTFANSWVSSGTGGTGAAVGGDLADLFLGTPTAGQYDLAARADYHAYYIGTFVQDDWRINSRLTVNLGLRFDIDTPYGEKFGRTVSGFDPKATNSASAAATAAFTAPTVP
jgi:outer membrane receptor protein involved in Fe transport